MDKDKDKDIKTLQIFLDALKLTSDAESTQQILAAEAYINSAIYS